MAASLIENDYIYCFDGVGADGEMILTKKKERFALAGLIFNYVRGSFLYKGEIGMKLGSLLISPHAVFSVAALR
jgi:hypothetical protein